MPHRYIYSRPQTGLHYVVTLSLFSDEIVCKRLVVTRISVFSLGFVCECLVVTLSGFFNVLSLPESSCSYWVTFVNASSWQKHVFSLVYVCKYPVVTWIYVSDLVIFIDANSHLSLRLQLGLCFWMPAYAWTNASLLRCKLIVYVLRLGYVYDSWYISSLGNVCDCHVYAKTFLKTNRNVKK